RTAGLSPREAEVLDLLAAVEADPRLQRLVAYVQDDVNKTRPTLHLLRRIFGEDGPLAVAADGRLRRAALVDITGDLPWSSRPVALAPAVTWALNGDPSLEPDLPPDTWVLAAPDAGGDPLVFVVGEDRVRRLQAAVTAAAGSSFLVVEEPTTPDAWQATVRTATLAGAGVVVEIESLTLSAAARGWLERADHLSWVVSSTAEVALEELPKRRWVEVRAPSPLATDEEWHNALGGAERKGHRVTAEQLRLVRSALDGVGGDLDASVRRLASGPLDRLAKRIRPRRTWDDLILHPDKKAVLSELTARYRQRPVVHGEWGFPEYPSAGLVALFSGPSGTGKSLSAEIIAGELGLDLYKLDLSAVVSKYIGETEKNLEKVFGAASATNVVLFFDEADSIFGKRSEVTDAKDRYANIEVSYLLQRIESYDGLIVLATNFSKNIDDAFLRRIHVSLEFPTPEAEERTLIWRNAIPASAPTKDIDFERLGKQFELAGGNIKNAALHAAFVAADAGEPITMEHISVALKREFQKLGRLSVGMGL
ncbi:MAG TPA: AAA family ATPase, partial [Acidimicrobiales bacterium]|nr:AAA family ATPase [Acidimicrobiales bacterium]